MPRQPHTYYTYIHTNNSGTLYTGVTNNMESRLLQHRTAGPETFTGRYKIGRLVYYEETPDARAAIAREKQIKGCTRKRKFDLIASVNPRWRTLARSGDFPSGHKRA